MPTKKLCLGKKTNKVKKKEKKVVFLHRITNFSII